jgi:nucleoside transporter
MNMPDRSPSSSSSSSSPLLCMMMFLQYAVWGVWLPYLANYLGAPTAEGGLGFSGAQIGWILGLAGSIGAVSAPFLAGQIADRFINAEVYLGLLLIGGGIVKYITASATDYHNFLWLSILYSILYMPTLALTNSIAFAHLRDPENQFPRVRVWGTIGWIVASNAFPLIWLQTNLRFTALPPFLEGTPLADNVARLADCLRVSGMIAVGYGLFAMLALPRTPPKRDAENPLAFAKAFALLLHPGFLVVTLVALPISMIHQVYFIRTGPFLTDALNFDVSRVGPIMSIGQVSEIFFLAILGWFIASLGYRWTLALGCLAYFIRFALFAIATEQTRGLVVAANALHGLCYGCFFAGAYIYVERVSAADIRHSAQTVFAIIILGLGPVLAGFYNQWLDRFTRVSEVDGALVQSYPELWWVQAGIAAASLVLLVVAFRPGLSSRAAEGGRAMLEPEGM